MLGARLVEGAKAAPGQDGQALERGDLGRIGLDIFGLTVLGWRDHE